MPVNEMIMAGGGLPPSKTVFNYTGYDQTYTVPWGVTSILVKLWAGGGASHLGAIYGSGHGGGGAFVTGKLAVTPGQVLTIIVGQGGNLIPDVRPYGGGGSGAGGNGGGGRSAIIVDGTEIATAGGGGAGGVNYYGTPGDYAFGGPGGLSEGGDGGYSASGDPRGTGGTQMAGGSPSGSLRQGGNGYSGGGGGYYGGGAGGYGGGGGAGGGGGGSSYLSGLTETSASEGGVLTSPGGTSDGDWSAGIGAGAPYAASATGGHGRVVIIPQ